METSLLDLISFFPHAIISSIITGLILSISGLFLHVRRSLFLGAAMPHLAGLGYVAAEVISVPGWLGAIIFLAVGSFVMAMRTPESKNPLTAEAMISVGYVIAIAGTLLILVFSNAEAHAATLLLSGSVLTITPFKTLILGLIGIPLTVGLILFRRNLLFVALDSEAASAAGFNPRAIEGLVYLVIGVSIILTLEATGAMASFAFLLFPGLIALNLCKKVSTLFICAPITGIISGGAGILASLAFDLPAGPAMVSVLVALWLISMIAPTRFLN